MYKKSLIILFVLYIIVKSNAFEEILNSNSLKDQINLEEKVDNIDIYENENSYKEKTEYGFKGINNGEEVIIISKNLFEIRIEDTLKFLKKCESLKIIDNYEKIVIDILFLKNPDFIDSFIGLYKHCKEENICSHSMLKKANNLLLFHKNIHNNINGSLKKFLTLLEENWLFSLIKEDSISALFEGSYKQKQMVDNLKDILSQYIFYNESKEEACRKEFLKILE